MIVSVRHDTRNASFLKTVFCLGGILFCSSVSAEILLREPGPDGRVSLLPENQKKIVQFQTPEQRRAELEKDKKTKQFYFSNLPMIMGYSSSLAFFQLEHIFSAASSATAHTATARGRGRTTPAI